MTDVRAKAIDLKERLLKLPPALQPSQRRYYAEALTPETRAPIEEYYRLQEVAAKAHTEWAKQHGAGSYVVPGRGMTVTRFAWERGMAPQGNPAWCKAERQGNWDVCRLSRKKEGKALRAEVVKLPRFPKSSEATAHLNAVTTFQKGTGFTGVGYSNNRIHYTGLVRVKDRLFIQGVNHNYDLNSIADGILEYPEYAENSDLDFKEDYTAWRPAEGWNLLTEAEMDFIIAEYNLQLQKET